MKKLSVFREITGNILGFLSLAVVSFHSASAQDLTKSHILQNKADEQEVRLHTAAVVTQIQSLIDELAANGISGEDIKVLNATKTALANLSGPEMDRVISSLQKAGEASSPAASQQNVVNAYADQKGIILQFRQILKDYEQRQAAYELPLRFKELSKRQTETMMTSAGVARATAGKTASELTTMEQTTQQIVQADQEAIGNETNLAIDQLNKAALESTQDDAKALQQAQNDIKSSVLQKALSQANDSLKAGQLLKALSEQKIARDELRHIAEDLNPPTNAVDALAATNASLAKLIAEQKSLVDQTSAAISTKTGVGGLNDKQGALVDETNSLQQDMQSMSATAADLVKGAMNPMQMSRTALGTGWGWEKTFVTAIFWQNQALDKLNEAQKLLQQQVADAQKAAEDATKDPVAKLQDLQKQIQTAMQQQQKLSSQTTQALNATPPDATATTQAQQEQSKLQQQAASLQQTAQPLSLTASQALAKANAAMDQAQQDLTDSSKTPDAQAAQQTAQAALAQADQEIGQEIAQNQQQAADPAALAAAADSLQKAQTSVSSAIADASPASSDPSANNPPTPSMADAAAALAAAAKDTQAAANTPGLPGSAAAAVQQAQASIAQGQQQAAQGDAKGTASSAAAAEQSLAQAQASVAMARAGLAAAGAPAPGTPGGPPLPGGTPGMTHSPPGPDKPGKDGAKTVTGGSTDKGTLHDTTGNGKFVTVASRDRAAIDQTQAEKRPQEYAPMIDQYMKNLADQSSSSTP